jgi:micrococcal nuclease
VTPGVTARVDAPRAAARTALALLIALLVPGISAGQAPRTLTGAVVWVVDGDTIHVRLGDRLEKVRYIGVRAPEFQHRTKGDEPGGREATEANRRLVAGQTVRLELDREERDAYGRLLAYVYVGDVMVNAELIGHGYARASSIAPNLRHRALFLQRQRVARLRHLGLWKDAGSPPDPRAPDSPSRPRTTRPECSAQRPRCRPPRRSRRAPRCPARERRQPLPSSPMRIGLDNAGARHGGLIPSTTPSSRCDAPRPSRSAASSRSLPREAGGRW